MLPVNNQKILCEWKGYANIIVALLPAMCSPIPNLPGNEGRVWGYSNPLATGSKTPPLLFLFDIYSVHRAA